MLDSAPKQVKVHQKANAQNAAAQQSKANVVQNQVDEVVGIMQNNIEKVVARGEKLDSLNTKTEDLSHNALQFKKTSVKVESEMYSLIKSGGGET